MPMNPRLMRPLAGVPSGTPASLLLKFDGADASTVFTDSSSNNLTVTGYGDAQISTAQSKWGGSSLLLGGNDSPLVDAYLEFGPDPALAMGTGDFTLEMWGYFNSYNQGTFWESGPVGGGSDRNNCFVFFVVPDGGVQLFHNGNYLITTASAVVPLSQWTHLALVRLNGVTKVYIDGVEVGSTSDPISDTAGYGLISAGQEGGLSGNWQLDGWMDDFRIVKGLAVYTGPFIPPTAPLKPYAKPEPVQREASLLLHFDGADESTVFTDSSVNGLTVTANGDAQISTAQSKWGGASGYFDGDGDYLTFPALSSIGTGDFTVECWLRMDDVDVYTGLVGASNTGDFGIHIKPGSEAGAIGVAIHNEYYIATTTNSDLTANTWQHIAVVRASGTLRIYVDGVLQDDGEAVSTESITFGNAIGCNNADNGSIGQYLGGYVDDFRIVVGLAVYTAAFTPPAGPLSAKAAPN